MSFPFIGALGIDALAHYLISKLSHYVLWMLSHDLPIYRSAGYWCISTL